MPIKSAHWSFTDNGDGTTDHFLLAPEGTRSDIPVFVKDSAGNVTGLVGAGGGRISQLQMGVPDGLDWLTDTISGFDIYERGFVKRPTLFFDPTATSSLNRGTYAHPYNTQAALQAAISGNMAGHVLGLKRGTTLQVTGTNGLSLDCYGSSAYPFFIVPYGDAEELPIISSHSAVTTWALCAGSTTVYKYTLATESDIWQNGTRVWKLNPTNAATNNNTGTTVTNEATAVTALDAKGAGWSVYVGGVLYFRPYSGENPNLGQCVIAVSNHAFRLAYTDWAGASGYVTMAGIDARYSLSTAFKVEAAGATAITSAGGIVIAGCRAGKAGVDTASPQASDAFLVYGVSDTVRLSSLLIAGNEGYDALNNAFEIAGVDGSASKNAIIEHNYGHDVGGNSLLELWASNSNVTLRYNYGKNSSTFGRMYTSFSGGAIWFNNNAEAAGVWNGNDATNAKNANNIAVFNLAENCGSVCVDARGGTGLVAAHNTFVQDHDAMFGATASVSTKPTGLYTLGTGATGFLTWSNNLLYYKASTQVPEGYLNTSFVNLANGTLGAANSVPSGNNNLYFVQTGYAVANWRAGGVSNANFTNWKTAVSAYALDQNSLCALGAANAYGNAGGTLTIASLGFNETTFTPLASAAAGITTLTTIGTRYRDGVPYSAASATIGCHLGT